MTIIDANAGGVGGKPAISTFSLAPKARLAQSVEMNVRCMAHAFHESTEGQARHKEGRVRCIGAIYEIETGRVRFLDPKSPLK